MTENDAPATGGEQTEAEVQAGIGRVHEALEQGRAQDAVAATQDLLERFPGHPGPYHMLGVLLLRGGRPDQAAEALRRAAAINDRLPGVHYNLALALAALGQMDEALAELEKAIGLKPEHADAQAKRAGILAALERHDDAETGWQRVAALRPDDPGPLCGIAKAQLAAGRAGEALETLEAAITSHPDNSELVILKGRVLESSEGPGAALAWLEEGGPGEPLEAERVRLAALVSRSH